MYGSDKSDLVVKYYDQSFGLSGDQEIAWYLRKAEKFGGPVLDLACGTGRIAIRLDERGHSVTGIDQSMGMLQQFRRKIEDLPESVSSRIQIIQTNMAGFALYASFKLILCCDGFFYNLTLDDQIRLPKRGCTLTVPLRVRSSITGWRLYKQSNFKGFAAYFSGEEEESK